MALKRCEKKYDETGWESHKEYRLGTSVVTMQLANDEMRSSKCDYSYHNNAFNI